MTSFVKSAAIAAAATLMLAGPALAAQKCTEYAFQSNDLKVDKPFDHLEIASINVGDMTRIADVIVTTKLLVKQFNGVKLSVDVLPPDGAKGVPEKTVVLKNELRNNPNFLFDHMKPLKLKVEWRDDAELTLGEALEGMKQKEVKAAKKDFVTIVARPDTSLAHFVRGMSANAGSGGSRGTWELRVENKSFRNREHVRLLNWDLTLCSEEAQATANEAALSDFVFTEGEGEGDDVIFRHVVGSNIGRIGSNVGRLGAGLPRLGAGLPRLGAGLPRLGAGLPRLGGQGGRLFGRLGGEGGLFSRSSEASAEETQQSGGLLSRLRPQALVQQPTNGRFRVFRLWRRTDGAEAEGALTELEPEAELPELN
ncbi:hypothetical protein HKI87_02g11300 [Chloropicon roscoffensis]|uniref:Uncharacterized protein n=2 Tax=Chloropicon roscoffensis TaxID=1461544 RepID=A0AAX4P0Y9_9CHLO